MWSAASRLMAEVNAAVLGCDPLRSHWLRRMLEQQRPQFLYLGERWVRAPQASGINRSEGVNA